RVHGSIEAFSYYLGVYNGQSVATGRMGADMDSYLLNASVGLQAGRLMNNGMRLDFRGDFLHSTDETGYYAFENAFAISARFGIEQFDLRAEFMNGTSHDDQAVSGFYVMPSYFIVPGNLQAVLRYENASADTGVAIGHNRYADRVPSIYRAGEDYFAVYAGVNYYVFGDNLKFMLGAELAENSGPGNESGQAITVVSGFRMQF
ncbi:hypothetical protein QLX67_05150, partial [Balneolaceae bacterium ANBcel3]|nr:hypothetical protein [Balneolaceae bacterium ANBcel3]